MEDQVSGGIFYSIYAKISFDVPSLIATAICKINFHIVTSPAKSALRTLAGSALYTFIMYRITSTMDKQTDAWNHYLEITKYVAAVTLGKGGDVEVKDRWF
jgi:hypothetical protein